MIRVHAIADLTGRQFQPECFLSVDGFGLALNFGLEKGSNFAKDYLFLMETTKSLLALKFGLHGLPHKKHSVWNTYPLVSFFKNFQGFLSN